jgi:hypothetical protein
LVKTIGVLLFLSILSSFKLSLDLGWLNIYVA